MALLDGKAAIGAPYEWDDVDDMPVGSVHVFDTTSLTELYSFANASRASGEIGYFGESLLATDSELLVSDMDQEEVDSYQLGSSAATLQQTFVTPLSASTSRFGTAFAWTSDSRLVVTDRTAANSVYVSGKTYIFDASATEISTLRKNNTQTLNHFGVSHGGARRPSDCRPPGV